MNISVKLEGNEAALRLMKEIGGVPEGRLMWQAVAAAEEDLVKQHLYKRDAAPNKLNAPKTHFWKQAGDSVGSTTRSGEAEIQVKQIGVRQQWKGGVITPKNTGALTIPLRAVAHGKRASELGNLFFLKRQRGRRLGFLARKSGTKRIEVIYALLTSVNQKADPSVMPSDSEMSTLAADTALFVLRKILQQHTA